MARTEAFRALGGFDDRFRRRAELDLAVRAAFAGAHFISVDAPLVTQYLTPTADKAGDAQLRYRLLRLWYLAALVCFPWRVSWGLLRRSSLLAGLRMPLARAASP